MAGKPGESANLDSPMSGFPAVKGLASAPGKYSSHPNLGPAGVDGGMPLKFMDDSVKGNIGPVDNPMFVTPTPHTTTGSTAPPKTSKRGYPEKDGR